MKPAYWLALSLTSLFAGVSVLAWNEMLPSHTSSASMPAARLPSPPIVADQRSSNRSLPSVQVLVAKESVPAWCPISEPEMYFKLVESPQSVAPQSALRAFEEVRNQSLRRSLVVGECLSSDCLVTPEQAGLIAKLSPGMRAIGLKINAEAVHGFLLPGSHVDVLWINRFGGYDAVWKTILQNALVLDVEKKANHGSTTPLTLVLTVTVVATPAGAERLSASTAYGELRLVPLPE